MDYQSKSHVVTLANSIIGVSVLAMPYCFKQCGIVLAITMLIISSIIARMACHFLLKSAIIARRRTFEYLAFHIFGGFGKFLVEVGMIGFLIGTCIAFFVVIGDLGPEIVTEITGTRTSNTMRTSIMMALALFCVLPLGLLRNVDSLVGVSKVTIGFYVCLVLKIIAEAILHIFSGDWYKHVILWQPAGIIQCLPIFSMALSCQTQLFEIYQVLHNPTLEKMNNLVRIAVNICTLVYIFVGFFGYIAFFTKPFTGNILLSFSPSIGTDVMKIGFILSLAFSFPLVIFPCRASLYSLLYREGFSSHEGMSNYIPEGKFKSITFFIVFLSLIFGILMPNIELVLGLVGSTIGIAICILFPVTCFIYISEKNTNERILAKIILFIGIIIMVLGTYKNLKHFETVESPTVIIESANKIFPLPANIVSTSKGKPTNLETVAPVVKKPLEQEREIRLEPPNPLESELKKNTDKIGDSVMESNVLENPEIPNKPLNSVEIKEKDSKQLDSQNRQPEVVKPQQSPEDSQNIDKIILKPPLNADSDKKDKPGQVNISEEINKEPPNLEVRHEPVEPMEPQENEDERAPKLKLKNSDAKENLSVPKENIDLLKRSLGGNNNISNEIDIEAIKKEEREAGLQETKTVKYNEHDASHQMLIDTLQKQNEVQKEIVEQQKRLIEVIASQQKDHNIKDVDKVNEEKLKAVKHIESIALKAIEQIRSGKDDKLEESQQNIKDNVKNDFELKNNQIKTDGNKAIADNNIPNEINLVDSNIEKHKDSITNLVEPGKILPSNPNSSLISKNNTAPLFLNLGQANASIKVDPKRNLSIPFALYDSSKLNDTKIEKLLEAQHLVTHKDSKKVKDTRTDVQSDDVKAIHSDTL